MPALIRAAALLAALSSCATPAHAGSRHRPRVVCAAYFDPGAGPVRICASPYRPRRHP